MSSGIGGGGIGGPRGPSGPGGKGPTTGVDGAESRPGAQGVDSAGQPLQVDAGGAAAIGAPSAGTIERLASDLQAGRISADEALAQLISEAVPGGLPDLERSELRAALGDLLATDPYLAGLAARLGATRPA
jgi:hypothetical protein